MIGDLAELVGAQFVMLVWVEVAQSLVELIHEDTVVGLAEVLVRVASELVVAVNHAADALHDPLGLVNWADDVLVAVEDGDWDLVDGRNWDIRGDSALRTGCVLRRELLESIFDTVLEVMLESLGGDGFGLPHVMLFAP